MEEDLRFLKEADELATGVLFSRIHDAIVRAQSLNSVSLYHLDSKCLKKTLEAPPMAEEIVYIDDEIYILNESASKKYIFGKFLSGNNIYSYEYTLD